MTLEHVDTPTCRLACLVDGEGPLLVLQHGFPDTPHTWDAIRPVLVARGYRVVAPFLRGYFPSTVPSDGRYDAETLARDVLAVLDHYSPDAPALLVAHDFGASAAYGAAALAPERLRKLFTVAIPHPAVIKPSLGLMWKVRHFMTLRMPGAAKRLRANDFAGVETLVRRWSPKWDLDPEELQAVKECFGPEGSAEAACAFYGQITARLPDCHRKKIEVPTVAFAGESDGALDDIGFYDRARSRFTGEYEVVRMPGGHFLHREDPELFERELLARLP